MPMRLLSPMYMAEYIVKNINSKKAPRLHDVSPESVSEYFKTKQIIMLKTLNNPAQQITSCRPISPLPAFPKMSEKLLLNLLRAYPRKKEVLSCRIPRCLSNF